MPNEKDISALLAAATDESADDITKFLKSSISMETLKWGHCPNCRKKVQVDYPDFNGAHKLLQLWLDRGLGKQTNAAKPAGTSEKVNLGKPIEKMTAKERDAYAARLISEHPELKDRFKIIRAEALAAVVPPRDA